LNHPSKAYTIGRFNKVATMNPEQYDRFIYEEARKFLLAQEVAGLDAALLDKYLQPPAARTHINSVPQIYRHCAAAGHGPG
jgi:hypothetical protein